MRKLQAFGIYVGIWLITQFLLAILIQVAEIASPQVAFFAFVIAQGTGIYLAYQWYWYNKFPFIKENK